MKLGDIVGKMKKSGQVGPVFSSTFRPNKEF
ncbi:hypothetical protein A2U01_0046509, partial [Trifolium medium]|nr:hypothetical protein [Trifolium medium]